MSREIECAGCRLEIPSPQTNQKYCTVKCRVDTNNRKSRELREARYADIDSRPLCERCDVPFVPSREGSSRPQRFCSHLCASRSTAKRGTSRPLLNCERCGDETFRRFCSTKCASSQRREERLGAWLRGESPASNSDGSLSASAKKFLLEEAGFQCTSCGWDKPNPVTGKPILAVDHIDGDWRNNLRSNLRVLCFNCHTLTPTFGSLNRGKGSKRSVRSRSVR